jgi:uracil-DNA glycosylase
MLPPIPAGWRTQLEEETRKPYFQQLQQFLERERRQYKIYPPEEDTFQALELTPYRDVNVLLLGQDPYPGPGQGHGLSFSVRKGVPIPASLRNIYKELVNDDVPFRIPNNGYLAPWAEQGMLMLNAVLTVRDHQPNSHKGKGWETFTDTIIASVNAKRSRVVFVLWGAYAQKKAALIDTARHRIVAAAHPSPLSARNGFFGKKSFSSINKALKEAGKPEIDWQIPDV